MGHYAKVVDGNVVQVIVAEPEFFNTFVDSSPGAWIQTSYNTRSNVHYTPSTNEPSGQPPLRGNYAGIGFKYDQENDVFYPPSPYPSWTMDTNTWTWTPPTPMPTDGKAYRWDEPTTSWIEITPGV
jgi:hypothetical protein